MSCLIPVISGFQGLIYRFEVLMIVTLICAALTVIFFIISNVNEAHWKFGDEESTVEISSECEHEFQRDRFLFHVSAGKETPRKYFSFVRPLRPLPFLIARL